MNCELCQNTGYLSIEVKRPDGTLTSYAKPCDHGRNGGTPAGEFEQIGRLGDRVIERLQTNGPELIEQALARHAGDLLPAEIQIARLIGRRVGQGAAIRIADLIQVLGDAWTDRDIKAMIARLRTLAKLPIAATKAPPYGFFVPGTAQEVDEAHDRYMREGIKLIILAQNFREDKDLVQQLRGQLSLEAR